MSYRSDSSTLSALAASLPLGIQLMGLVLLAVVLPLAFALPFTVESLIKSDSRKLELQSEQSVRELERFAKRRISVMRILSQADVLEQNDIRAINQYLSEIDEADETTYDATGIWSLKISQSSWRRSRGGFWQHGNLWKE